MLSQIVARAVSTTKKNATTCVIGFKIKEQRGPLINEPLLLEMIAFDSPNMVEPSPTAQFSAPYQGQILDGSGSPALKLRTDSNGYFRCELANAPRTPLYVVVSDTYGGPTVADSDILVVTY